MTDNRTWVLELNGGYGGGLIYVRADLIGTMTTRVRREGEAPLTTITLTDHRGTEAIVRESPLDICLMMDGYVVESDWKPSEGADIDAEVDVPADLRERGGIHGGMKGGDQD